MENSNARVPKSFRYWFRLARIKQWREFGLHRREMTKYRHLVGYSRSPRFAAGTVDGRRRFRVLPHCDLMQICDGNFDRWANSVGAEVPMPKTEAEFLAAVDALLRDSAAKVAEQKRSAEANAQG